MMIRPLRPALLAAAALALSAPFVSAQEAPANQEQIKATIAKIREAEQKFQAIFTDPEALNDPAVRQAKGPEAAPHLKTILAGFDELVALQPSMKPNVTSARSSYESLLVVLGDAETKTRLETAAAGTGEDAQTAKATLMQSEWQLAGKDAAKQEAVVGQLETAAKAAPESIPVTVFAYRASQSAETPELAARLTTVLGTMKNEAAEQINEMVAAEAKIKSFENKPLTITGKTPDDKDFTTDQWKGKVVLVDFWATWCGPCVAELPEVKKVYAEYHDKGLEILGVSNDYKADALTKFIAKEEMPWPQIIDKDAAAKRQWHPVTGSFGIRGIPTMFLIDKKGVLRTVAARENYKEMIPKLLAE